MEKEVHEKGLLDICDLDSEKLAEIDKRSQFNININTQQEACVFLNMLKRAQRASNSCWKKRRSKRQVPQQRASVMNGGFSAEDWGL